MQERLDYHPSANKEQKDRVAKFNELLEEIHERKMELVKMEEALVDMRTEIVEENHILAGTADEVKVEEVEEPAEAAEVLSDDSDKLTEKEKKDRKRRSKGTKGKGKGWERPSKVSDSEMDVEWDYRLDVANAPKQQGRRASVAEDAEDTKIALLDAAPAVRSNLRTVIGSH